MLRVLAPLIFILLIGCDSNDTADEYKSDLKEVLPQTQANKNKFLAYVHQIEVTLEKSQLTNVFKSVLNTCYEDQEHNCLIVHSRISGGDYAYGRIELKVAPKGIAKYKSLAADSGELTQQSTTAEDLTHAVADTEKRLAMLNTYQAKLQQLEQNPNVNIESLIKVASELSQVQTQIEFAQGEKAKLYQRINMDVLHISLNTKRHESFASPISDALLMFADDFAEGIAIFITAAAYLAPWILLISLLFWLARLIWLRGKRQKNSW